MTGLINILYVTDVAYSILYYHNVQDNKIDWLI